MGETPAAASNGHRSLSPADRELLLTSAITPEIIEACGAYSGPPDKGFAIKWSDGVTSVWVRRVPDHMRKPKGPKYIWPKGETTFLDKVRDTGADKVIVVEGVRQHLAAAAHAPPGYDVFGMWGCDGIHAEVDLSWADGRDVFVCLDADRLTNDRVRKAAGRVARHLQDAGARSVGFVDVPAAEAGATTGLDDFLGALPEAERADAFAAMIPAPVRRTVDGWTFLAPGEPDEPPLWGHADAAALWSSGESLFIFGPPGAGKSTLAQLVVWARLGLLPDVLGFPVTDDGRRVLYLAMDRPKQIQRAMRRLVRPEHEKTLRDRLIVHRGPLDFAVTKEDQVTRLRDWAVELGAGTVVVDSIKDVIPNASDEEKAGLYNRARQSLLAAGIDLIELHHNRKANGTNKEPNTLEDVYGSRWLTAGAGSVISLWQDEPGSPVISLRHIRAAGEKLRDTTLILDTVTGGLETEQAATLEDFITTHPDGFTVMEAAAALHGPKPTKGQREAIRGRLKRMAARGALGADPFDSTRFGGTP
ncbi:AAA family ATPase [Streptomyces sp. NPDC001928]|uniref:AAA family ATPase n=1 Tax=Streptomyces sp. NPDC001928 TaxID=3154404 RepID=UPI0033192E2A